MIVWENFHVIAMYYLVFCVTEPISVDDNKNKDNMGYFLILEYNLRCKSLCFKIEDHFLTNICSMRWI